MVPLIEIPSPHDSGLRYCPTRTLPPYRYVPGLHPHPVRDPRGHSHGLLGRAERRPPWDPADWRTLADWLYGVDCFNAFFFWEAHESWETLWAAAPRESIPARVLQGLIQIAAALLKIHLGSPTGAATLSREGLDKLSASAALRPMLLGLDLRATSMQFTHYFRPLTERTLPPLDATVPRLVLSGSSDA
jgi:hypothetical protein